MRFGPLRSRLALLVAAVALVAAPAVALRLSCAGRSCEEAAGAASEVPFCSLPAGLRAPIAAGFEGELHRSPDILAVARQPINGGTVYEGRGPAWPSLGDADAGDVPIVLWGAGIDGEASVPDAIALDDVAPTLAEVMDLRRPNPEVRSGDAIPGVATADPPRLVLVVALKGVGTAEVADAAGEWPNLHRLLDDGTGRLDAEAGSLPLDPAATLTTIGTGGLPSQHGITGTVVRNDEAAVVRAWGPASPIHIIATLADDLDEHRGQRPKIGLVATALEDRGLIGGNWYVDVDRDEVVRAPRSPVDGVRAILKRGFARDDVVDLLAVVLDGQAEGLDRELGRVVAAARKVSGDDVTVAVAGTGSRHASDIEGARLVKAIERGVPGTTDVVDEVVAGGIYLDQEALAEANITDDDVLNPIRSLRGPDGTRLFADAFPGIAVSFARYC